MAPFSADAQYFETSVLFAEHAYAGYHVTAKVKLVTGGRPDAVCPGHALLYVVDNDPDAGYPQSAGTPITFSTTGQWQDVTLNIPAPASVMSPSWGCGLRRTLASDPAPLLRATQSIGSSGGAAAREVGAREEEYHPKQPA